MSKKPSFMQRFGRKHVNGSQTLLRSARNQFHITLSMILDRGSKKRLVLVRSYVLGQFVNTLTPDYKYSRYNLDNLWQQVPRQISRKVNGFSRFFIAFVKSTLNLEYFEIKDQSQSLNITEIINCETNSYLYVEKVKFHARIPQITC